MEAELSEHLGYEPHDPAGHHSGNSRNGTRPKTVLTEIGPVELDVPRDRTATFQPIIVAKRQRRLGGVDQMVLSLSAKGLTHGEISAHLEEIYAPVLMLGDITGMRRGGTGRNPSVTASTGSDTRSLSTPRSVCRTRPRARKLIGNGRSTSTLTRFQCSPGCAKGRTNAPRQTVSRHDQRLLVNRPGPAIGAGGAAVMEVRRHAGI